jgi:hypothetical protein
LPRSIDDLVQAMGLSGISKSQVSKLCKDIDERHSCLPRPSAGRRVAVSVTRRHLPEAARGTAASNASSAEVSQPAISSSARSRAIDRLRFELYPS